MYDIILCGVFKNESHILEEWINHYLSRGVDHIYLINDNSSDNYQDTIEKYKDKVTLYHNDIPHDVPNRQVSIYNKYFLPILNTSKWAMIIDLDEFIYSPTNKSFKDILLENDNFSQLHIDWLNFGSSGYIEQPCTVISNFTKRASFDTSKNYYSYKCIFKTISLKEFGIHFNSVNGDTKHFKYSDIVTPDLVLNHYSIQSREYYLNTKLKRHDVNDYHLHCNTTRDIQFFNNWDTNDIDDTRLVEQNNSIHKELLTQATPPAWPPLQPVSSPVACPSALLISVSTTTQSVEPPALIQSPEYNRLYTTPLAP